MKFFKLGPLAKQIIKSLQEEPNAWAYVSNYRILHKKSNMYLWVANNAFGIELEGLREDNSDFIGISKFSSREKRAIWKQVKKWFDFPVKGIGEESPKVKHENNVIYIERK